MSQEERDEEKARLGADFWAALAASPWQYDLFQLLRRIDAQGGARYPLGCAPQPRDELLRIRQLPSLAFAPATLAQVSPQPAASELAARYEIAVCNFGLFGPNGPLPLHLTEYAYERIHHAQDHSLAAFADLFHHRLALLFWRGWANGQPTVSLDRHDQQQFIHYLACLTGSGLLPQRNSDSLGIHASFAVAGHLSRHGRDAETVSRVLSHYFQIPVRLRENVPHWLPLDRRDQARIMVGRQASRLGQSAFLGSRVYDRQQRFGLELGPMSLATYRTFLPAQPGVRQLRDWIRRLLGIEFIWEARLLLAAGEISGVTLGGEMQLGWTSWLGASAMAQTRGDSVFCPENAAREL